MEGHVDEVLTVSAAEIEMPAGPPGSSPSRSRPRPIIVSGSKDQSLRVWTKGDGDAKLTYTCTQTLTGCGDVRHCFDVSSVR